MILGAAAVASAVATAILSANGVLKGHVWIGWCLYSLAGVLLSWAAANVWVTWKRDAGIKVKLTPVPGPSPEQLLTVENLGTPLSFRAYCTLLDRRNDPNHLHRSTFNMEWLDPQKASVMLPRGGSCNLIVAKADVIEGRQIEGRPLEENMDRIEMCGLSGTREGEAKESSRWNRGDKLPEYDLKITITGENHGPHIECFTVRPGRTSALEMFAIPCPKNGTLSRPLDSAM